MSILSKIHTTPQSPLPLIHITTEETAFVFCSAETKSGLRLATASFEFLVPAEDAQIRVEQSGFYIQ